MGTTPHPRGRVGYYALNLNARSCAALQDRALAHANQFFATAAPAPCASSMHISLTTLGKEKRREADLAELPQAKALGTMCVGTVTALVGSKSRGVLVATVDLHGGLTTESGLPHITLMRAEGVPASAGRTLLVDPPDDVVNIQLDGALVVSGMVEFEAVGQPRDTPRVWICKDLTTLSEMLVGRVSATFEVEEGDQIVEGSVLTLAHHGPRAANSAPCLWSTGVLGLEVAAFLHLDADALLGYMGARGKAREDRRSFYELCAFVDLHGAHMLPEAGASSADLVRWAALEAAIEDAAIHAPRDGGVLDVTAPVRALEAAAERILNDDPELLEAGQRWFASRDRLERESFRCFEGAVVVREATTFVNDLYRHGTRVAAACVSRNPTTGFITISIARPSLGQHCGQIAKTLWGARAGGHVGCAGSPYEYQPIEEVARAVAALNNII